MSVRVSLYAFIKIERVPNAIIRHDGATPVFVSRTQFAGGFTGTPRVSAAVTMRRRSIISPDIITFASEPLFHAEQQSISKSVPRYGRFSSSPGTPILVHVGVGMVVTEPGAALRERFRVEHATRGAASGAIATRRTNKSRIKDTSERLVDGGGTALGRRPKAGAFRDQARIRSPRESRSKTKRRLEGARRDDAHTRI